MSTIDATSELGALLHRRRDQILEIVRRHRGRNVRVFGSVARGEADELVTEQLLRAELAGLRAEMVQRMRQQTIWLGGAIAAATGVLAALTTLT